MKHIVKKMVTGDLVGKNESDTTCPDAPTVIELVEYCTC